jgi:hypothetical protein
LPYFELLPAPLGGVLEPEAPPMPVPPVVEPPDVPPVPPDAPPVEPAPALPPVVEPVLPPALELLLPCCCRHLVRSAPVIPTHWLGVELAPALLPEAPVLPEAPLAPLAPCEDELPEAPLAPLLPLLDLSPAATAAVARKAENTAALMSFNVIEMSPGRLGNCEHRPLQSRCRGEPAIPPKKPAS